MQFLAQNHSALTHLPIATAILAAISAIACLFTVKKEAVSAWVLFSVIAFLTAIPLLITGTAAAKGRFNSEGKPYIQSGILVANVPANTRVFVHQSLGIAGFALSAALALCAIAKVRGRNPSIYLVILLALAVAICWGIGGHLGGKELWSPDTFPGFN
jgi:uncharacterized membrane protein